MKMDKEQLVAVAQYETDWQAHIAMGVLAEHGINSVIDNEIMGTILPISFNSIGQFRLMVFKTDLEKAREILNL